MSTYTAQKRDGNEDALVKAFEQMPGVWCQSVPRECGYDLIVHGLFIFSLVVEIKQITGTLTPNEIKTRDRVRSIGGLYCVVRFTQQVESLIALARDARTFGWGLATIRNEIEKMDLV